MAAVTLVQMSEQVFDAWNERLIHEFAAENVTAGRWTPDEAEARSRAQNEAELPDGYATPGQQLWSILDSDGVRVGSLWLALDSRRPGHSFIYDIEIDEPRRGEGLGRAALEALEAWCAEHAIDSIGLHVFGNNAVARGLYARMGYIETNVQMEKKL